MGTDRFHWDLVSDDNECPALLAAANAKIVELNSELTALYSAQAASEDRVREVVRDAIRGELDDRKLYVVRLHQPTIGEMALEAYGHGKACDAVALQGDGLQALLDAIATRAARQLAGVVVGLSEDERGLLDRMLVRLTTYPDDCGPDAAPMVALFLRLLSHRTTP